MSVTGHRNEKSLDDSVDSFSTVRSKQLSNIISGRETVTGVGDASKVGPLQIRDRNTSAVPCTSTPSMADQQRQFPVLNLANLAQNMENSTINITVNTNRQHADVLTRFQKRRIQTEYSCEKTPSSSIL